MSTVLVAHPHESLREEACAALDAAGHQVVRATHGDEAVRRAVEMDADVVVVSSHLPDREGREVCRLLRESPKGRELGILIAGPEFWEPGVGGFVVGELGVDGFVALPCRRSTLLAAVQGVSERFRRSTPLPADGLTDSIEAVFARLDHEDYYRLLGVSRDCSPEALRDAFHRVSMLYHPDRHRALRGGPSYDRVNAVYKRIAEAWKGLSDPESRARYDRGLAQGRLRLPDSRRALGEGLGGGASLEAELEDENARKFYQLGKGSEDSRDYRAARMNYVFALQYAPDHPALLEAVGRVERVLGLRDAPPAPPPALEEPEPPSAAPDRPTDLPAHLPRHLAIIMDGNGRWAQGQGLDRIEGHRRGAQSVRTITRACRRWGIKNLTLYAFSEQNWDRPEDEVAALMELLADYVRSERDEIMDNDIRLDGIGDLAKLPDIAREGLQALMEESHGNEGMRLCLALSYGGREEIVEAARQAARRVRDGELDPEALSVDSFRGFLSRPDLPDPDLVIRTSGEMRVSNFLLWQIAYAEFHVTSTAWPEFGEEALLDALKDFAARERRFGKTGEQVRSDGPDDTVGA